MSDLIDRNIVNQALTEYIEGLNECTDHIVPVSLLMAVQGIIRTIPTAEPKKGHWIGISDGYADGYPVYDQWECSCCGVIEEDDEPTWNYCPNCGAKMEVV